jgi:hypothetical protein
MGALKLQPKPTREDVFVQTSERKGLSGILETFLRRFRTLAFVALLAPVAAVCVMALGVSAAPGLYLFHLTGEITQGWPGLLRYLALGIGAASSFMVYGLSLIFVIPLVNFLNPFKVKACRGPWYSISSVPWYFHNALTYMVRYTFLEFITPSPLNVLFFKMMGMKIGKGVVINTSNISDPCMITLGDYVTLGGSATLFAHSGQKGYLIIAPVTIGKGTTVGLKASIMGGVRVGENVTVRPHAVLLPKTQVKDGETV